MLYKITHQYARSEEEFLAEFSNFDDAQLFVTTKSSITEIEKKHVLYRMFEDTQLLHEINPDNITTAHAQYAEGNGDLNLVPLTFKVFIKTHNSEEKMELARFDDRSDANRFIACKYNSDETISDEDLFFIYKGQDLVDTSTKVISSARKSDRSKNQEKGASFRPTPLNIRHKPPGAVGDYWIENEDDEEK